MLKCDSPNGGRKNSDIVPAKLGKNIYVLVNLFKLNLSSKPLTIYRYNLSIVSIGFKRDFAPDESKRKQKSLEVAQSREVLGRFAAKVRLNPQQYVFDGRHMLLTTERLRPDKGEEELQLRERGLPFKVEYELIKPLDVAAAAAAFLQGEAGGLDDTNREVLQCLDVVVRHCISLLPSVLPRGPSAFFVDHRLNQGNIVSLGQGSEVAVGFRAAISLNTNGLFLSVDTCATAMIPEQSLIDFMAKALSDDERPQTLENTRQAMMHSGLAAFREVQHKVKRLIKNIKQMQVLTAVPPSRTQNRIPGVREFEIKGFEKATPPRTAETYIFAASCNGEEKHNMSVEEYFYDKYGLRLKYPKLPLIMVGSKTAFPAEFLRVKAALVKGKPSAQQTGVLASEAAFLPQRRKNDIQNIVRQQLQLLPAGSQADDPLGYRVMREFGLQLQLDGDRMSDGLHRVPARQLPAPYMDGERVLIPSSDGFFGSSANKVKTPGTLKSWVVLSIPSRGAVRPEYLEGFTQGLVASLSSVGIQVPHTVDARKSMMPPIIYMEDDTVQNAVSEAFQEHRDQQEKLEENGQLGQQQLQDDPEMDAIITHVRLQCMKKDSFRRQPDILVILLDGNGNSQWYRRIKAYANHAGYVTQCVSAGKAKVGHPNDRGRNSYLKNLVMKMNVKLGGTNFVIADTQNLGQDRAQWRPEPFRGERLCVFGIDVNHDSESQPSVAAVVASVDDACTRYVSEVLMQQQARREIVDGIAEAARKLLQGYKEANKEYPTMILVLRDGVGDSQIQEMYEIEIKGIQKVCAELGINAKMVVITLQKRHNMRLFPEDKRGDRRGNVMIGTVVEGLGSMTGLDFLLVAHSGNLGTLKGVRFIKVFDEVGLTPDEVQRLMYWLSYLNCRCMRPASVCAPIFYADLAAKQGRFLLLDSGDHSSDGSRSTLPRQRFGDRADPGCLQNTPGSGPTHEQLQALEVVELEEAARAAQIQTADSLPLRDENGKLMWQNQDPQSAEQLSVAGTSGTHDSHGDSTLAASATELELPLPPPPPQAPGPGEASMPARPNVFASFQMKELRLSKKMWMV